MAGGGAGCVSLKNHCYSLEQAMHNLNIPLDRTGIGESCDNFY